VLGKYGVRSASSVNTFIATWSAISGQQLGATLTNLRPANDVNVFEIRVPVGERRSLAAQSVESEPVTEAVEPQPATGGDAATVGPIVAEPVDTGAVVQAGAVLPVDTGAAVAPGAAVTASVVTEAGR
jgi:hypothetical protein